MNQLTPQNPSSIQEMFSLVSKKYDLTNSILSFGIHHRWKKKLIHESHFKKGDHILDCATGTGDLAFLFEAGLKNSGKVIGSDFCLPMLEIAQAKAKKMRSQTHFEWADVMDLPYLDHSFDIVSISFGIRNVKNTQKALSELGRVVKPGGRILVLEFGQPQIPWIAYLFNFYSKWILPRMGGWISGQPQAYQYLKNSSATFPCGKDFLKIAESTGFFSNLSYIPLHFGIAYLYRIQKKS